MPETWATIWAFTKPSRVPTQSLVIGTSCWVTWTTSTSGGGGATTSFFSQPARNSAAADSRGVRTRWRLTKVVGFPGDEVLFNLSNCLARYIGALVLLLLCTEAWPVAH